MRILRSLEELRSPLPAPVLTIGNFDGVHRAHQRILARVVERARAQLKPSGQALRGTSVAMVFEPHPAKVLAPDQAPPLLTTLEQKLQLLEATGLDVVLVVPFTGEFSRLSPRQFVEEMICRRLGTRAVYVGANFRFGHRAAGDVAVLGELAREFDFALKVVPRVVVRGQTASSTLIRHLIAEGRLNRAALLLGRPYALTGEIQPGRGRGAPMGFPTLNLLPEQECLPARGVYISETLVDGRTHRSATNVGVRPTFGGDTLVVESHLLDFSRRVERGRLEVRFYDRLRPEKKFPSPEALRAQIQRDVERTRRFFARLRQPGGRRRGRVSAARG